MRYRSEHKAETRQKIVKDASRRVRAEGMTGAAVTTVMKDAGLTHGGFYKHFESKDSLLAESLGAAFNEIADRLELAAAKAKPGSAWKEIVRYYLGAEHCEHSEYGCPLAALAPELARADGEMKQRIVEEMVRYRGRLLPFMPGRRAVDKERAFFQIFSTMLGAIGLARILPEPIRANVLSNARDFLLGSFQ